MNRRIAMLATTLLVVLGSVLSASPASARVNYLWRPPVVMRHHAGPLTEFGHGADVHWKFGWQSGMHRPNQGWVRPAAIELLVKYRYGPLIDCSYSPFAYEGTVFHISIKDPYTGMRQFTAVHVPCRTWHLTVKKSVSMADFLNFHFYSGCNRDKWPRVRVTAQDQYWNLKDSWHTMGPKKFFNPRC